jgi:D-serine deaminase-like pyridoxal phosphate-dependent protein
MLFPELDTPCIVIDDEIVERNLAQYQDYCDRHDLRLRPHIKTHKLPEMALRQLALGAVGITCQKIGEAEVFAEAGCRDILLTFNIVGTQKLTRLRRLAERVVLRVVADNEVVARALSGAFSDRSLEVLVECDTGAGRCGVQAPDAAAELAMLLDSLPGTRFGGLMTYPPQFAEAAVDDWLRLARDACRASGLNVETVSSGGTPSMWRAHRASVVTEHRSGTYIYNDRSLMHRATCVERDCALAVLTTVVSRPTGDRVVVDAGSKALTADLFGLEGYGYVREYPDACIYSLSEEHGCIDMRGCTARPEIGERLRVIPNHVCPVTNLFDEVHIHRRGAVTNTLAVAARGKVA